MTLSPGLAAAVRTWIADDPDPANRLELEALLLDATRGGTGAADAGPVGATGPVDAASAAELTDRFAGRLRFGTAGLRGAVAAGPNRMNRAVVRTATAALAAWLADHQATARFDGVVVGCDARHGSASFADEVARVLVGGGFRVHLLEPQRPTPLLAYAVRHLRAAAGVMITASHNPPADNGYKLYLGDGAQIVPPVDAEIEALMDTVGPLSAVPTGDPAGPLVTHHGPEVADAYLAALARESPASAGSESLRIVYTPLHGVALGLFRPALERAGFPPPVVVAAQAEPNPDFPTVAFPNPEVPGALDLALDEARRTGADVVIANDPDGDRLAVAVPDAGAEGGWRPLTGDQVGALLADYLITRSADEPDAESRLVATTIVSSTLLSKIAAAAGVHYTETLTGFKWIVRACEAVPGGRFLFGYEEALGYAVGTVVRDKDGIGAALAFLGLLTEARTRGLGPLDLLDALETRHGVHLTSQLSFRTDAPDLSMTRLREHPPVEIGGREIVESVDLSTPLDGISTGLPPADVLIYRLNGARIVVRPSGTEPALKVYVEVVGDVTVGAAPAGAAAAGGGAPAGALAGARERARAEMSLLRKAVADMLAL